MIVHWETIHVGSHTDGVTRTVAFNDSDNRAFDQISIDISNTPIAKVLTDDGTGAFRVKAMLWVAV